MHVSGNTTISQLLDFHVQSHPDKPFVIFEGEDGIVETISYENFRSQVRRMAGALAQAGVRKGDRVALMMGNSTEFLVSWFGINQIGAVLVSINTNSTPKELQFILDHSQSIAFIVDSEYANAFGLIANECASVKIKVSKNGANSVDEFEDFDQFLANDWEIDMPHQVAAADPAQILYTSGTTSRPKGVVISHRSSLIQAIAISQTLGMNSEDRTCVVLPMFHVNGQYVGVMPTLAVGGTIVLFESYSASRFWRQIRHHRCTAISIVPMLLRTMLLQPVDPGDADHCVRISFYALTTSDAEWDAFENRFNVRLIEGYGLSETLGICTCNPLVHGENRRHSVGLPVLGREIRVLDEDGTDCPPGSYGRIMVKGEPIFSGYFKDTKSTDAALHDGWLDTGDNGYFDDQGYLFFVDRTKDIIKRGGENIAASEVERVLLLHADVAEAAVIAIPDEIRDEAVKAYIVPASGASCDEAELTAFCAEHLSQFKVPTVFEIIAELPKTSVGKVQKYLLKQERSRS